MPATPAWLAAVESVLNRSIADSSRAGDRRAPLERDLDQDRGRGVFGHPRLGRRPSDLALTAADDDAADAVIAGSPLAFLALLAGGLGNAGTPGGTRSGRRADQRRRGSCRAVPRSCSNARGRISRRSSRALIGDLPARRVSLAASSAFSWVRRFGRTAGENLAEYLQEESRDLVNKPELEEFLAGVDDLRETADRVEARLAHVEQRLKGAT